MRSIKEDIESLELKKTDSDIVRLGCSNLEKKLSIPKKKGQVIVFGARQAMGKSAFALDLIRSFAFTENKAAIYFSFELSSKDISKRLISQASGVSFQKINNSDFNDEDLKDMSEGIFKLKNLPIYIEDSHGMDTNHLIRSMVEVSYKEELGLIIIDYLQLSPVENTLKIIREIADELKVPIIILSQLKRTVDLRDDKRPTLEDLLESEEIMKYSDSILLLFRKSFYERKTSSPECAELIIAKNVNGDTGTINMEWNSDTLSFSC